MHLWASNVDFWFERMKPLLPTEEEARQNKPAPKSAYNPGNPAPQSVVSLQGLSLGQCLLFEPLHGNRLGRQFVSYGES